VLFTALRPSRNVVALANIVDVDESSPTTHQIPIIS